MKGGSFEREVCTLLSKWWTNGKRDDIFGRSDGSGSRFTARMKRGKDTANQCGDITFTDSIGEPLIKIWSTECKTGYGGKEKIKDASGVVVKSIQYRWDILDLIDSSQKQTVFEMMWEQCFRDANLSNREPVLIFRRNQRKICIAMTSDYFGKFVPLYGQPAFRIVRYDSNLHIFIMPIKEFLEWAHDFSNLIGKIH
jgi:hypothetical protein